MDEIKPALTHSKEALCKAIHEADMLLCYAASHALNIDEITVTNIVKSKELLDKDQHDPSTFSQQIAFWKARNDLATAVRPVSASSLKQTTFRFPDNTPFAKTRAKLFGRSDTTTTEAEVTVRRMQFRILIPLIMLIVLQVYTLVGSTVVAELSPLLKLSREYVSDKEKIAFSAAKPVDSLEMRTLEAQLAATESEMMIRVKILNQWNAGWNWISPIFNWLGENHTPMKTEIATLSNSYEALQSSVLSAHFALQVLQRFLLPLLYGSLGASLFVLRSLAADVKAYTFDLDRRVAYHLRLYMGTLAGLVVAWFIPDSPESSTVKNLSPYAFSVLAGYSVDLVFAFMDKFIAAFSSQQTNLVKKELGK